jgi:hypothetical protein
MFTVVTILQGAVAYVLWNPLQRQRADRVRAQRIRPVLQPGQREVQNLNKRRAKNGWAKTHLFDASVPFRSERVGVC